MRIEVIRLDKPEDIFPADQKSLEWEDASSTMIVKFIDYYSEK